MMEPAAREKWAKWVERLKASGLTTSEFAAEVGINARSLSWWRWHLAKGETPTTSSEPRRRRRRSRGTSAAMTKAVAITPMTFVEMTAPLSTDALEVILPTTVRVCVRPGFDDKTLGRLLDVFPGLDEELPQEFVHRGTPQNIAANSTSMPGSIGLTR